MTLHDYRFLDRFSVSGADFAIDADREHLALDGTAAIEGVPMAVSWSTPNHVHVRAMLGRDERSALGLAELEELAGPVSVDFTATVDGDRVRSTGTIDLAEAMVEIPSLGWTKHAGAKAGLRFAAELRPDGALDIPHFALESRDLTATGALELDAHRALAALQTHVVQGESDFRLRRHGRDTVIFGDRFDARPLVDRLQGTGGPQGSNAERTVHVDLGHVRLSEDVTLDRVSGLVEVERGRLRAASGRVSLRGAPLSLRAHRRPDGYRIDARSTDAGRLSSALGIPGSIRGGNAHITGVLSRALVFDGRAVMRRFRVDRPPPAARVISATSIAGILALIRGEGLHFDRADIRFSLSKKSLEIADAHTSGGPLGLSARGRIDLDSRQAHLLARAAPLDDINKLIRHIPVLGRLLAPEGDALLFAPSYRIDGDLDHAEVRVQPHTLLIPAFLRRLFE